MAEMNVQTRFRREIYMQDKGFTEKDWKLFRSKIAGWQENYMAGLLREYMEILNEDTNPSDRFWKLNDRLKEDRKKTGVVVDMRRSQMENDLLKLIYEGAISLEELEGFSEGLRERIRFMVERP